MDLRAFNLTDKQLSEATHLACRGLLCYQPFIFSDTLMTGAGYEFAEIAEGAGLVYCKDVPQEYIGNASVNRHLIDLSKDNFILEKFIDRNQQLRNLYETMIDLVEAKVGPINELTVADIGSCSGYFPLSFSKRGAKQAVGYDVIDYTPTYKLLNSILGANAEFRHRAYVSEQGKIEGSDQDKFDVVFSIAVLVHMSDPLKHLAYLGQMARKAIVVWTYTSEDEKDMVLRFQSVNRYYHDKKFPHCFDVVQLSPELLRRSLELMGFTEIYPIENTPDGMPEYWFNRHRGYLAIRNDKKSTSDDTRWSHEELEKDFGPVPGVQAPQLLNSINGYNIVAFRGMFLGIPQTLGAIDLTELSESEITALDGILIKDSTSAVQEAIQNQNQQTAIDKVLAPNTPKELKPNTFWFQLKKFFSS